jgi:hypothetical protein
MTYNDRLDADERKCMEEEISSILCEKAIDISDASYSLAASAILETVLETFRPDLMEGGDLPAVAIRGNLSDGFKVVGPYENLEDAGVHEVGPGNDVQLLEMFPPVEDLE